MLPRYNYRPFILSSSLPRDQDIYPSTLYDCTMERFLSVHKTHSNELCITFLNNATQCIMLTCLQQEFSDFWCELWVVSFCGLHCQHFTYRFLFYLCVLNGFNCFKSPRAHYTKGKGEMGGWFEYIYVCGLCV